MLYKIGDRVLVESDYIREGRKEGVIVQQGENGYGVGLFYRVQFDGGKVDFLVFPDEIKSYADGYQPEEAEYYYTTSTPHRWSSGPVFHYWDDRGDKIASMERARELALAAQHGEVGEKDYVEVGYGARYKVKGK